MKRTHRIAAASLPVMAALTVSAGLAAAPAHADTAADVFLSVLDGSGLVGLDQGTAVRVGQQVCPMLAEPGQNLANVAADVSDSIGRPLGPATMFTGLAIQIFCPGAVSALATGNSPIPLPIPGLF
ncbi:MULTISPECIES: DUF732 domain-containing protein [Mycobacteriaceae]|jgi:hypothetical protein|uniref:DUF732 domain-containing protein n=1 Tax=Mycobacteriaceae TaxID=1762 RepID=UPI0008022BB5|nr:MULTISPECIES: DUF732 domain-containing protein [Mycobacteriaceae]MCK0173134.1 DUF732 domain-containing protein [Mycolicibacterium sp. F2034L]OBB61110.1 hypothetical protein A5757_00310 [Mycobacterium sp. 852013-51886_SCH5428379]